MENIELYKDIYTIAKPLIDPLVKTLLQPKLEALSGWLKKQKTYNEVTDHFFEDKFTEYLLRTYQNCFYINTIAFPNQQIKHSDIFYPVTLVNTKGYKGTKVDSLDLNFFTENYRILISDYAGMGKSTLSRYLTNTVIEKNLGVPVFIELRQINSENPILIEIYNQLNPLEEDLSSDFILKIISRGDFVVILDGFDEIPSKNQEFVIKNVRDFISKAPNNSFIMTSRPEAALSSFGDFQNFFIDPLSKKEAFNIIDKYDVISDIKVAKNLKADIDERITQIEEFLSNPFLVSLLYKSYTYNRDIPSKRVTFYDEVYSALYKAHDLSKDGYKRQKKSNLDIQDFRVVLRDLAFNTAKIREVEYSEQVFLEHLKQSKANTVGVEFKENDFLEDLLLSVPIIIRDGNKVKWAHKSIQDYFAAEFIVFHPKKEQILERIFNSQNDAFLNILILVQELDNKTFRKTVLHKLLKSYVAHCNKSYSSFEQTESVVTRKMLTYGLELCFLKSSKEIEHNEARKMVSNSYPKLKDQKFYCSLRVGANFFKLSSFDFNRQLVELLYNSYPSIYLDEISVGRAINELNLKPNKPLRLNANKSNKLNTLENFDAVNNLIYETLRLRIRSRAKNVMVLSIDKCQDEINSIEQEIKHEKDKDILEGI